MNGVASPFVIAQVVIRNAVPLVGILFFHWSAGNVLILYLLDTVLSMAVIIAGLASSFSPPPEGEGAAGWINAEFGYVAAGLFTAAFLAIPLGAPVGIMLAASEFSFRDAFHDHSLRIGALIQAALALWSYIGLYRALRTHSPIELRLRSRFALVLMRWVVVIMATYLVLDILPPGEFVLLLLVIAYIAGSIAAEVAPDRFLRAMPGGEDNLREDATSASRTPTLRNVRDATRRGKS
jgi:Family of unknown function (DUF6498)